VRVLLQRVAGSRVRVDGQIVGEIAGGLLLFVGIGQGDDESIAHRMAEKIVQLRIFCDAAGKFNLSLLDVKGDALVVSQFTLYADARKGRRPSFTDAASPETAKPLCEVFARRLRQLGVAHVACGQFGASMHVEIHNEGPVTLWLDSDEILGHR
jgi:D-aminoacyl-tRNA deacylase